MHFSTPSDPFFNIVLFIRSISYKYQFRCKIFDRNFAKVTKNAVMINSSNTNIDI